MQRIPVVGVKKEENDKNFDQNRFQKSMYKISQKFYEKRMKEKKDLEDAKK